MTIYDFIWLRSDDTHAVPKRNRTFRQHILQADGDTSVLCGGNQYEENIGC